MEWYFTVLRKYADFTGRARRKEYWMFQLFNTLAILVLYASDLFTSIYDTGTGIGILTMLYLVGVIVPGLAVKIRRLHDTGRSGWWYFIAVIPAVGWFIMLYFMVSDSEPGTNEYGSNPKGLE